MGTAERIARAAAEAARRLAVVPTAQKDLALAALAGALARHAGAIRRANAEDVAAARRGGAGGTFLDRLALDRARIARSAAAVEEIRALPDPVGEVVRTWRRPNGLIVEQVRLPLGVILVVYEARPNVTSDAAALCVKSGNAAILRGGKEAARTNRAIAAAIREALGEAGLPDAAVQVVLDPDRELLLALARQTGLVDLCIPRGGQGLMKFLAENARVPVVPHGEGICHVYADASADVAAAVPVIVNAKAQRPGVCNAAECLLVHRAAAKELLPAAGRALARAGVELRCDPASLAILRRAGIRAIPAAPSDFGHEFLEKILAVRVVRSLAGALDHIARFGSGHTEAILTRDLAAARTFEREVRASCVVVNASTRFNDGGELGLGAEIGISTGRLHAYGPMGLAELCSRKFVVHGEGQVRS